jgi:uncharacterized protein involved in cysteine biosynthesis
MHLAKSRAMLRAFTLSLGQLHDPAILSVLAKSLALTLVIFVVAGIGLTYAAQYLALGYGWGEEGGTLAGVLAALGAIAAAWLLFRAVAVPIIGIFADEVVAAVERAHYPAAAASAQPVSLALSLRLGLMSVTRLIGLNLLMLPVYGILLLTAIGPVIAFVIVNAILLGRDLGEMVAVRHLDHAACRAWLRTSRGQRSLLGLVVTGLFVVPVVNFIAPILGAAMATHLFHGGKRVI